jgi:hypothetical protein
MWVVKEISRKNRRAGETGPADVEYGLRAGVSEEGS